MLSSEWVKGNKAQESFLFTLLRRGGPWLELRGGSAACIADTPCGEPFWWEGSETPPHGWCLVGKVGLADDSGLHIS